MVLHLGLSQRAHKPFRMRERGFKVLSLPDFDPAIHKDKSTVPVVRWIPGSVPGDDPHGGRRTRRVRRQFIWWHETRVAMAGSRTKFLL